MCQYTALTPNCAYLCADCALNYYENGDPIVPHSFTDRECIGVLKVYLTQNNLYNI